MGGQQEPHGLHCISYLLPANWLGGLLPPTPNLLHWNYLMSLHLEEKGKEDLALLHPCSVGAREKAYGSLQGLPF